MDSWLHETLIFFSLPRVGLSTLFAVALISATLLPMGSEPAVFAYVQLQPHMFWPAVLVATLGNTVGGMISYAMGRGAHRAVEKVRRQPASDPHLRALRWLERMGPKACLLSWLPGVGDPLCAVAGWLRQPWLPCLAYMAIGKFLRYITMTWALVQGWNLLSP